MSLASWKREFYPVLASNVGRRAALAHSLQKWVGLRAANLKRHEVEVADGHVSPLQGSGSFGITSDSCALCYWHQGSLQCPSCPLTKLRKGLRCDVGENIDDDDDSPYVQFIIGGDPEPMIYLLERAVAAQKRRKGKVRRKHK